MFKSFFMSTFSVLVFAISTHSQNARIDAIGGCSMVPDVISVLKRPADINDYDFVLQGTAYGAKSFGPVVGTKSINDLISVGIFSDSTGKNGSSVLRGNFYSDAIKEIKKGNFEAAKLNQTTFPAIPHILFGMSFPTFAFGADLFFEGTGHMLETENSDSNMADETKKASIRNVGGLFNVKFAVGKVSLSPIIGFGHPNIRGEYKSDTSEVTSKSEKGVFFKFGTDGTMPWRNKLLGAGLFFTSESYQFKTDSKSSNINTTNFFDVYLGYSTEIFDRVLLAAQYDYTLQINTDENKDANSSDKINSSFHALRGGLEARLKGFWIFDNTIPRAGIVFKFDDNSRINKSSSSKIKIKNTASVNNFVLTSGLGISKGIATFDLNVELGNWGAIFTGPGAASASLTLDFGKITNKSSQDTKEEIPPAVVPPEAEVPSMVPQEISEEDQKKREDFDF